MSDVICRGSFALGTACGRCSKCLKEKENYQSSKSVHERLNGTSALKDCIETLEVSLAKSYESGMQCALGIIAAIGYGKNEDVDAGHEEAYRAIERHLADWKTAATSAEKGQPNDR